MMPRLPVTPKTQVPPEFQSQYAGVTEGDCGLTSTYQALFVNPELGSKLADLEGIISQGDEEARRNFTVALAVAHERGNHMLWDSIEPLARKSGVSDAVIEGIAAGTAPRGLLPKEGIWVQFALEVIHNQMRDSTWQAVTHLVGDAGVVTLAFSACYYEMMGRLNNIFGLDAA
ncbi:MAG TPA: hypothetical protein EYM99_03425 [Alphaproteobacteria bacterium]|nr:hypothetical protein [Alphaproteobacteria bacterium]